MITTLILLFITCTQVSFANENISKTTSQKDITTTFYQLPALQAEILSTEKVLSLSQTTWQSLPNAQAKLLTGVNWLQVRIVNLTSSEKSYFLLADDAFHLLNGQLYIQQANKTSNQLSIEKHKSNALSGQFMLKGYQQVTLYLMLNSKGQVSLSLSVLENRNFANYLAERTLYSAVAIGSIAMLALILLVVFIASGTQATLILCGFFSMQAMLLATLYGFNSYSYFPTLPELQAIELPFLISLSAVLMLWFSSELFKLKFTHPSLHFVFKITSSLFLIYLPISMFLALDMSLILSHLVNLTANLLLVFLGLHLIKTGQRLAILFMAIFIIQLLFSFANIVIFGWYQFNALLFTAAFGLNSFLISFLLSRQYAYQIEGKNKAQREALENEMISHNTQKELLALQNENQEQLEIRVQERTLELNIALQELEEANRELEQKNTLDELTGLYNRRFYDQRITAEFRRSRRNLTPLSLIIIDIDLFKKVNDTHGHLAGDACLVLLAEKIKQCLGRSTDFGCRYGGEEFCLILPETDCKGAIALAEEVRKTVGSENFVIGELSLSMTISCGVSTYQQEKQAAPEQLFAAADKALYQAKHQGRNQVLSQNIQELLPD